MSLILFQTFLTHRFFSGTELILKRSKSLLTTVLLVLAHSNTMKVKSYFLILFDRANFTTISNSGALNLFNYVKRQIDDYVTNVFLKLNSNDKESEDSIVEILNHDELDDDLKLEVIGNTHFTISDITKVDNGNWKYLLIYRRVKITWDNVIEYYKYVDEFDADL